MEREYGFIIGLSFGFAAILMLYSADWLPGFLSWFIGTLWGYISSVV